LRPRISGREGIAILKQIRERLTLISLTEDEYFTALETVSASIIGGAAYDALIARCAVKTGAEVLLTWNLRDFTRFGRSCLAPVKQDETAGPRINDLDRRGYSPIPADRPYRGTSS
jgi:hypothetical protein